MGSERVVRSALSSDDVLYDFLERNNVGNPEQYIRQAATGTLGFLPVQFYRALGQMSHEELLELVASVATRSQAKKKLLERLELGDDMKLSPPPVTSTYPSTLERRDYYDLLVGGFIDKVQFSTASQAQHFLEAIKSLDDDQIRMNVDQLLKLMKTTFDEYYGSEAKVVDALRRRRMPSRQRDVRRNVIAYRIPWLSEQLSHRSAVRRASTRARLDAAIHTPASCHRCDLGNLFFERIYSVRRIASNPTAGQRVGAWC